MVYVIHGATGAQGAPLFKRLTLSGKKPKAITRKADGTQPSVHIHADLASEQSLINAYRGAKGVFVHLPMAPEEDRLVYAKNIASAISVAKPERVVISTSGIIVDDPASPLQARSDSAIVTLINEVESSGVSSAVIAPRLYLENLLLPPIVKEVQEEGVLRYPIRDDFAVSWSSHLDVAEVAERLFEKADINGVVGVGSLPGLLGSDLAEGFSHYFGREVVFQRSSPISFGSLIRPYIGPATSAVEGLYFGLASTPANTIAEITSANVRLGLAPRSVPQWLSETLG